MDIRFRRGMKQEWREATAKNTNWRKSRRIRRNCTPERRREGAPPPFLPLANSVLKMVEPYDYDGGRPLQLQHELQLPIWWCTLLITFDWICRRESVCGNLGLTPACPSPLCFATKSLALLRLAPSFRPCRRCHCAPYPRRLPGPDHSLHGRRPLSANK